MWSGHSCPLLLTFDGRNSTSKSKASDRSVRPTHNSPTEALQEIRQFRGQGRREGQMLGGAWVLELQRRSMQKISRQREAAGFAANLPRGAVQRVSHYRMAQRCQVNPNLVGAAGVDLRLEQREFSVLRIQPALDRVVRDGFASTRA